MVQAVTKWKTSDGVLFDLENCREAELHQKKIDARKVVEARLDGIGNMLRERFTVDTWGDMECDLDKLVVFIDDNFEMKK